MGERLGYYPLYSQSITFSGISFQGSETHNFKMTSVSIDTSNQHILIPNFFFLPQDHPVFSFQIKRKENHFTIFE